MAYARQWIVKIEVSGRIYGPFSSAARADSWAVKNSGGGAWVVIRLRAS